MTKERRQELIAIVAKLQNHPANLSQDHMTICGFFDTEIEFKRHIDYLQNNIARQ